MYATKGLQFLTLVAVAVTASPLKARDSCTTLKVVSGDSCSTLASQCGISGADFISYNTDPNLCSTLVPGQLVCCSSGTLPDLSTQPNADGTCAKYTVVPGDYCSLIASSNGITVAQLQEYNANTPDWKSCDNLWVGDNICVSSGPFSL